MKNALRVVVALLISSVAVVLLLAVVFRERRPDVHFAVTRGDTNYLERYLTSGEDVNSAIVCYQFGHRSTSLLTLAVQWGRPEVVEYLLKKGANPNLVDQQGETPLIVVVSVGGLVEEGDTRARILRMLLQGGADPNLKARTDYGTYPLLRAAMLGETEMVRLLLAAGANVNATDGIGQSALDLAKGAEIVKVLTDAGAVRGMQTPNGEDSLWKGPTSGN